MWREASYTHTRIILNYTVGKLVQYFDSQLDPIAFGLISSANCYVLFKLLIRSGVRQRLKISSSESCTPIQFSWPHGTLAGWNSQGRRSRWISFGQDACGWKSSGPKGVPAVSKTLSLSPHSHSIKTSFILRLSKQHATWKITTKPPNQHPGTNKACAS